MKTWDCPGPADAADTFGRYLIRSSKFVTFSCCRVSLVNTCIVMGTSCAFSVRRCAVTTTSWMPPADASDGLSAAVAYVAAAVWAPRIDATARAHFGLILIGALPPRVICGRRVRCRALIRWTH